MEDITILLPTYNRRKFIFLFLRNIRIQDYPHDKIKVIIEDDGVNPFIIEDDELDYIREELKPIQISYHYSKIKKSIGQKRNSLIKKCKSQIFCFMDDDDIYQSTYLSHSYEVLKKGKYGCVGSDKMLFTMSENNYDIHAIDCGNNKHMIHEATIMGTKKWFRASPKFGNNSRGEGSQLFSGTIKSVGITDIQKIMVCLQHSGNSVDKLQFAKEENRLEINLNDELINLLDKILKN
jgi:glycosyltransferase involved in cell wall biosynthesis